MNPRRAGWAVAVLLLAAVAGAPASAAAALAEPAADLDDLLDLGRSLSPRLAAAALEADAAAARADGAGLLPDPTFTINFEDIDANASGLPGSLPRMRKYQIQQMIPFPGTRNLERDMATADADRMTAMLADARNELVARLKIAWAEYVQLGVVTTETRGVRDMLATLADLAAVRYGQGFSDQSEAVGAAAEVSAIDARLADLEGRRAGLAARLNALAARPSGSPLAELTAARPLPPEAEIDPATLFDRALADNPLFRAQKAALREADASRALADKSWYPDVGVGFAIVDEEGEIAGYEVMLEVSIPLQWDARRSAIREAGARRGAVESGLRALELDLRGEIEEGWNSLRAARRVEQVIREGSLPQARIAFEGAVKAYELGMVSGLSVLDAARRLQTTLIELYDVELVQQMRLADLERLVGSDL